MSGAPRGQFHYARSWSIDRTRIVAQELASHFPKRSPLGLVVVLHVLQVIPPFCHPALDTPFKGQALHIVIRLFFKMICEPRRCTGTAASRRSCKYQLGLHMRSRRACTKTWRSSAGETVLPQYQMTLRTPAARKTLYSEAIVG